MSTRYPMLSYCNIQYRPKNFDDYTDVILSMVKEDPDRYYKEILTFVYRYPKRKQSLKLLERKLNKQHGFKADLLHRKIKA